MYTVHLDTLRTIHDFQCIAETINRWCLAYGINPLLLMSRWDSNSRLQAWQFYL